MVWAMNKRGNVILDSITVVVVLLIFAVVGVLAYDFFGEINDGIQDESDLTADAKTEAQTMYDRFPAVFDSLFLFVFLLIWVLALVASYLVDASPIFYILMFILLIFVIFIGAELANAYFEITDDIGNTSFPMTNFIMTHFVAFIISIGITVSIVLYGKNKYLGGGP